MVDRFPINEEQIDRAAQELMDDFGNKALETAQRRARDLRSEGFDSMAEAWDLISEVIRDQEDSNHTAGSYKIALRKTVLLSE